MTEDSGADRRRLATPVLRAVSQLCSTLLIGLYTATVAVGALSTPLVALLSLSSLLALGATALYLWATRSGSHDRPRSQIVDAGSAGASLLPYVSGAQLLGVLGAAITLCLLALAVVALAAALGARPVPATPPAAPRRTSPALRPEGPGTDAGTDEAALRALLHHAPLPMLFRRWHATGRTVTGSHSPQGYVMAVYLRGLLLDELHARDPVGARRWVDEGGAHPPERHIRDDRALSD